MRNRGVEFAVGLFVLAGLLCTAWLAVRLGKMEAVGGEGYPVQARFLDVTGLKAGSAVEMAGVRVGRVESIGLSPEKRAVVTMRIDKGVTLTDDAIVSVRSSGLIGDKFLKITPGGGDPVKPGALLTETESSVDIQELMGKYVFGGVKEEKK
ncbi:putative phospholipid ABC transporter-binding protein MlaD [Fundidesulfovibrio magnetotacticus]|uniref:Putative phospholipid ABC transporter-binding protein MlaD n=1 Tax=Fundidesulfovibrio magnetotacticus TaxID=2730080 RepID=A0A6V8LZ53_9BACT|nr:outer membrane lipid asymmetry maintenance protein MlaD [Fundidesulfovibrio magnetotacticus]GFK95066.1 putative phospholipid ABC transporter-binding protein MlaD [Fundidesulfovibrio magnetotacticus]